jgi:hypothetical protein
MATANKFNIFAQDVGRAVHNLNSDSLKDALTNTSPNAADTVVDTTTSTLTVKATSNAAEIAAGNGYTKGGTAVGSNAYSQSAGTGSLTGNNVVFTASGGTIGPFRYVFLYNNTAGTTATRAPILWWDYGSAVTLNDGETFTVDHSGGILTIA